MQHFELLAVHTVIQNIKGQLQGLETLLAAAANQPQKNGHTIVKNNVSPIDDGGYSLSDKEEQDLDGVMRQMFAEQEKAAKVAEKSQKLAMDLFEQAAHSAAEHST